MYETGDNRKHQLIPTSEKDLHTQPVRNDLKN